MVMVWMSDGIPGEHVGRAFERRERWPERGLELGIDLFRRPAIGAVHDADRSGLVEQEDLVAAHPEDLPGDTLGAVGAEVDRERRDLFSRHLLHTGDPRLLLGRFGRN